jgi:hypothetical protein
MGFPAHLAGLGLDAYVLRVDTLWVVAVVIHIISVIQHLSHALVVVVRNHRETMAALGFRPGLLGLVAGGWSTVYRWP